MATVTITGASVRDVTGLPDNRAWYLAAVTYQDGHDGGVVTPKRSQALLPVAGVLSFEAEPGVTVRIQNPDGDAWYVVIPDSDADLWDLIAAAVAFPPNTADEAVGAAVDFYLDEHPVLPDRLKFEGDWDTSGDGDYMVNDVVRYTDPAPSPTTDLTGLYACITDHTVGSPKDFPSRWRLVAAGSWSGLAGKPAVIAAGASAAAARAAVGASAVGDAVFTAGDAAAARDAVEALGLVQAAKNPDLLVTGAVTVDGNDLVTSAAVVWPDGSPGTLTITSRDGNGAVLAYNITYGSPVTKTFTQPAITRNANGAATNVPAIVVS